MTGVSFRFTSRGPFPTAKMAALKAGSRTDIATRRATTPSVSGTVATVRERTAPIKAGWDSGATTTTKTVSQKETEPLQNSL